MHVGGIGGCDFATPSNYTARDTTVFWAPEVDSSVVLLAAAPPTLPTETARATILQPDKTRRASDGLYIAHGHGRAMAYSVLLGLGRIDEPAVVLVPLGGSATERLSATDRLWRTAGDRPTTDTRVTRQRRLRLRQMLRAVDGHTARASHRQIAQAIFGGKRVDAELWHESSLRYATMRLLRDGQAMVDGGYRKLLRTRRTA